MKHILKSVICVFYIKWLKQLILKINIGFIPEIYDKHIW